ncbi:MULTISPECIES: ferritin-like domain-containing protein [Leeuwenhoekiella]|uniref:Ferritin-like protein n=1 Tax=Leeuwenhoekiella aequorea TaxID=283736 RepID=A0A4Q0PAG0_9FLAO|nr:ferritin-like domain-containing protein [Leeuwenhoekiella aequorea]RXG23615.1 ferritin-like protein [Leeuwenhoekiella aequorea]|tara:strand:+ start:676 stop:1506 length:831 start_codon:yes stop_codon:yes gene_type:complete
MNIIKFLDEFTTDQLQAPMSSRRAMFGQLGNISKKAAMLAVPFGLATMGNKAQAQSSSDVTAVLNLALTLEYLEDEFYDLALQSGVLTTAKSQAIYAQIAKHESQHVTFLTSAIEAQGATPVAKPTFDFTVGGAFDPFMNNANTTQATAYAQLLALAQAFEDTGVRAYKGQAANLIGNDAVLTAALQIHSVEARHASEIRRLRGLEGWITGNQRGEGMPEATQAVYNGEENVTQGGVDVTTLGSGTPFSVDSSTQAYDEILTGDQAVEIASLFIVS